MMNSRENCLAAIHGERSDYVPLATDEIAMIGIVITDLEQPFTAKDDIWGCPWMATKEGALHKPGFQLFDDITEWEKYVKFPDLDQFDFKALAEAGSAMLPPVDYTKVVTEFIDGGGLFLRLAGFMGFENALYSLAAEPEACTRLFEALTEFRLKFIEKLFDAIHPDIYTYGDDIATERSLFMSPECYRELIKPFDERIAEQIKKHDVVLERHCCGKCEAVIPDFIEIGVQMWQSAQPVNDLAGILDKYQGKISMEGGWDTTGMPSRIQATPEEIRAEVRRCLTEYKKPGFLLWPSIINEKGNSVLVGDPRLEDLRDEWEKYKYF